MSQTVWPFLLTTLVLVGSPGPNTMSVAAVGAAYGKRRGLPYLTGICLGVLLVVMLVGTGVAALILSFPGVAPVVTMLAAVYLVYLAYRIATAKPIVRVDGTSLSQAPAWYAGVALAVANPKAYAAVGASFSQHTLVAHSAWQDALFKASLFMAAIVLVNLVWLHVGAAIASQLADPDRSRWVNQVFAALLLISVIWVMFR